MASSTAELKREGLSVPDGDGKPLRAPNGDLILRHDDESLQIPFALDRGDITPPSGAMLLWLKSMPSTGVTIRMRGFTSSVTTDQYPSPLRFDWALYTGGTCVADDEPLWEASTFWTPKSTREGILVQVTSVSSASWFLRVQIEDPGNGVPVDLRGSLEYFCPVGPVSGNPSIISGPFIG